MKDFLDRLGIVPSPTEEASQLLQVSNRVEIGRALFFAKAPVQVCSKSNVIAVAG